MFLFRGLQLRVGTSIGLAALIFSVSPAASAQWYLGGGAGQSSTRFNTTDFGLGSALVSESQDKSKTAYKIFAGYDFTRNWAIEGAYSNLGKPRYKYSGVGALAGTAGQADFRESAWSIAAKGALPLNEQFNVFGKLGLASDKAKATGSSNSAALNALAGFPITVSKTRGSGLFGLGGELNVAKNVGIRLEYEDYGKFGDANNTGRTKASMWSLGLGYKF